MNNNYCLAELYENTNFEIFNLHGLRMEYNIG